MSKNKNKNNLSDIAQIKSEMKRLGKLLEKSRIGCSHKKGNGKNRLKIKKDGSGDAICKTCGTKFNIAKIDEKSLAKSAAVMHNAFNQLMLYSNSKNSDDVNFVKLLGQMDVNILTVVEKYAAIVLEKGIGVKNKKNKNNKSSITYIGNMPY